MNPQPLLELAVLELLFPAFAFLVGVVIGGVIVWDRFRRRRDARGRFIKRG